MQNAYSKYFLGIIILLVNRFSKFLRNFLFYHFWIAKDDMVYIFLVVFQKSEILKNAVSDRWCADSN